MEIRTQKDLLQYRDGIVNDLIRTNEFCTWSNTAMEYAEWCKGSKLHLNGLQTDVYQDVPYQIFDMTRLARSGGSFLSVNSDPFCGITHEIEVGLEEIRRGVLAISSFTNCVLTRLGGNFELKGVKGDCSNSKIHMSLSRKTGKSFTVSSYDYFFHVLNPENRPLSSNDFKAKLDKSRKIMNQLCKMDLIPRIHKEIEYILPYFSQDLSQLQEVRSEGYSIGSLIELLAIHGSLLVASESKSEYRSNADNVWDRIPSNAIDLLRPICEVNGKFNADEMRRLRGNLCLSLGAGESIVNAMSINEFVKQSRLAELGLQIEKKDTKTDTPKKKKKVYQWNAEAEQCKEFWIKELAIDPSTTKKHAVAEFAEDKGIPGSTLNKRFSGNPDRWKEDIKRI